MKEKERGKESTGKKGAGRERGNSQFSGTISLKIQLLVVVIGEQFRGETPGENESERGHGGGSGRGMKGKVMDD